MPAHKGKLSPHDITEIPGADVLYSPKGIIRESEANAEELFGTARTLYSTEGSSLSIKAMMALAIVSARERGERALILAGRNAHKSFLYAAALLDFDIEWIWGDGLIECKLTPKILRVAIQRAERLPTALYITSPDYLGNLNDISALSAVCREYGILLLVDNAHGAYLKFLPEDKHPLTLGADMCCDSAHKTLPSLTGAAYLHISKNAPQELSERADEAMALFASTSPSYLILESLDLLNAYIAAEYREKLKNFMKISEKVRLKLRDSGFSVIGDEPLKITLKTKEYGYTGRHFGEILESLGHFPEFYDDDFLVLMLSAEFAEEKMRKILDTLLQIPRLKKIPGKKISVPRLEKALSPREAMLSPSEEISVDLSVGRILSSAAVSCPPAVPIAISGELITKEAVRCFKYYGTEILRVVK